MSIRILPVVVIVVVAALSPRATAQGLRVETQVYETCAVAAGQNRTLLSSSLSLFHNGRVYDYVESADEVVIYEPTARRFTVLNPARSLATTVDFDEIGHLLDSREPKVQQYITELRQSQTSNADQVIRQLRFQLNPEFETKFDPREQSLMLVAPSWKYHVSVRPWNDEDQRQRYLTYCDWTARLNSILHPASKFPEPRMALNAKLRELENLMPVAVELDLRPDDSRILRAEHRFRQNLDDVDRSLILRWDTAAGSNRLKTLSFRRYQEAVLASNSR